MDRYVPKGDINTLSPEQRADIVSSILGDEFYLKHLNPTILGQLRHAEPDQQGRGLGHTARFEHLVFGVHGGREAFEFSKLTPEQRQAIQARREAEAEETAVREAAQRMLSLSNLPEDIAAKLRSPKYTTVAKGVRLGKEWLAAKQAEREAAQAIIDQQQLVETLASLLEQAESLYGDIESLLKQQDLTSERRQKLQELPDTNEDHCDSPIRLTHWIDKAQTEIGRTTRKLAKSTVPEPTDSSLRRVDWKAIDAKRMPDVGKPNVQAVGTATRGVAVALAGKNSQELTRRGKKKGKK
jgi:hypothetical protein